MKKNNANISSCFGSLFYWSFPIFTTEQGFFLGWVGDEGNFYLLKGSAIAITVSVTVTFTNFA